MSETRSDGPFFHARAVYAFKPNRNYRVYIMPGELLFVVGGPGGGGQFAAQMAIQGGLVGGLIGGLMAKGLQQKDAARVAALDALAPDEVVRLAEEGKDNFRLPGAEVEEATIEPPGVKNSNGHAGRLRLVHPTRGKITLELLTPDDVRTAIDALPPLLGDTLKVGVEWDEKRKGFVRKR